MVRFSINVIKKLTLIVNIKYKTDFFWNMEYNCKLCIIYIHIQLFIGNFKAAL